MPIRRRNIEETHRDTFTISLYRMGTVASMAFGVLPVACELVEVEEIHDTAGTHGSAVTLTIEKLRPAEASGSGNTLMSNTFNLKGATDTVQTGTLVSVGRNESLTKPPFSHPLCNLCWG